MSKISISVLRIIVTGHHNDVDYIYIYIYIYIYM